jgi:sec-independent protein translocase protein TatB
MFDIGAQELLIIIVVAVIVIGPKELPTALRTAGRWMGKVRRVSNHFRSGVETMIREAEMEEMEKKWKEQNERVMAEHPSAEMQPINAETMAPSGVNKPKPEEKEEAPAASAESKAADAEPAQPAGADRGEEPQLPLGGAKQ